MITAPFNFVPLNEEVFYPDWAEDVSHDVPFEDGESGVIDVIITAKSPIFVRDSENETKFCNHNGKYYIPSSSVKGMVRNVLEIMSFSKLNENQFTDNTYAVRDLSKSDNFYMSQMNQHKHTTYCGWLKKTDNGYIIEDCGIPGRIQHNQIDYALNVDFSSHFQSNTFKAQDKEQKTSAYKYNLVNNEIHTIKVGEKYKSKTNAKYDLREFYKYDVNGKNEASLVLTGQPTSRKNSGKMGDGKGFEFLFFNSTKELKVDKDVFNNFLFAYFDKRETEPKESPDWTYWKAKLNNSEKVPVFFQKNGNKIVHFGLSYLYKLPYSHSVKDGIYENHINNPRLDLAQTIFGYIDTNSKKSLKGRVQFSHFKAVSNIQELNERREILGTPRASYYPMYVKQYNTEFKTFMDSSFEIAGRKRYPIHRGSAVVRTQDTGNENVGTTFQPLRDGTVFKGKLRYHNLKKAELGAILSVLTFHNTANTFHNIGMAKSLGYGKVSIKIDGVSNLEEYLKEFELYVSEQILDWRDSPQLKELLSMASEQNNSGNSKLEYMELKQFANNKTGTTKDYLKSYTQLKDIKIIPVNTLINEDDLKKIEIENQEFKRREEERKEQEKKREKYLQDLEVIKSTDNIQVIKNFISKYPDSDEVENLYCKINNLASMNEDNKHTKVNDEAKKAWDGIHNPKYAKSLKKSLQSFIKKWEKKNKGSEFVIELVEKAKSELKNV